MIAQEILGYLLLAHRGSMRALVQAILLLGVLVYFLLCARRLWKIDVSQHRLPDKIVLPMYAGIGLPLFLVLLLAHDGLRIRQTAYGAVFLAGVYWLLRLVSGRALGLGDVKLAGVIGMLCGFFSAPHILWATLLAFVLGGLFSVSLVVTGRASAKTQLAFGPFMLMGASLAIFFPA